MLISHHNCLVPGGKILLLINGQLVRQTDSSGLSLVIGFISFLLLVLILLDIDVDCILVHVRNFVA